MGRILCIDYGTKRIGLAISDETRTIARGLDTLTVTAEHLDRRETPYSRAVSAKGPPEFTQVLAAIARIVAEQEVERIILGYPLSQAGNPTQRSRQVEEFKAMLTRAVSVPIELVDERFSSVLARQYLSEAYRNVRAQRHPVDKVAAVVILEDYLERNRKSVESVDKNPENGTADGR